MTGPDPGALDQAGDRWWTPALDQWSTGATEDIRRELATVREAERTLFESSSRRFVTSRQRLPGLRRPTVIVDSDAESAARLARAIDGLSAGNPGQSSRQLMGRRSRRGLAGFAVANLVLFLLWPINLFIAWIAVITVIYTATIIERVVLFVRSLDDGAIDVVSDEEARAFPDDQLPTFSVLVPAYHEPEVIQHLLRAVGGMEYPTEKLQVMLLLEADDESTIAAATGVDMSLAVDIVLVPAAEPRTKPKALNYGIQHATGDIVTIYDAEDVPEPLQLRRAAVVLDRHGDNVACVQAQLSFSNVHQNIITRWFTLEYAVWFALFLPGLVSIGAPIPLGGTSNHFRRTVLDELGAWDPYNVTEDADLGVRMHRRGYRTRMMESITLEEANSDFVNWVKQRSRWYKGYLQTWIVNMRHPRQLLRELGLSGFMRFNLFVGGTPALAVLNPVFWSLTILWFADKPHFIRELFPAPVFYLGLLCWAVGNFTIAYLWVIATRLTRRFDLLIAALLVPLYWVMMSVAAIKALVQLVVNPSYWEKTAHGLDTDHEDAAPADASDGVPAL